MILVHGECGSGKSAALRAVEAAPPAGVRAVYVPVPTLDFSGLAMWSAERLGLAAGDDPAAALRSASRLGRILLLVDDADSLPLDAALALRQLERDAGGALGIVAACASDRRASPPVVALGPPARMIEVAAGRGQAAAVAVCELFAPARAAAPAASAAKLAAAATPLPRAAAATSAAAPPRSEAKPVASAPREPRDARPAVAPSAAPSATALARPVRTVPLSLAIAVACAAFLLPVAFGVGYVMGGTQRGGAPAAVAAALPEVSSPPPAAQADPPRAIVSAPAQEATPVAAPQTLEVASSAPAAPVARREPRRAVSPAPVARTETNASAPRAEPAVAAPAPERVEAEETAREWGVPALISVEPGSGGP